MTTRALTILIVAVLLIGGAAAVMASTMSGDSTGANHSMQDGSTMPGVTMER